MLYLILHIHHYKLFYLEKGWFLRVVFCKKWVVFSKIGVGFWNLGNHFMLFWWIIKKYQVSTNKKQSIFLGINCSCFLFIFLNFVARLQFLHAILLCFLLIILSIYFSCGILWYFLKWTTFREYHLPSYLA